MSLRIPFDRIADRYDETRALPADIAEQVTQQILRLSQATPTTHFFEPGIGTGRIALPLIEQGYAYTGVDISEPMMTKLRQKVAGTPHRLTLLAADATALPLATDTFDVAIAAHLLHLIPEWQTALDEMLRVLKPDGCLIYFHHPHHAPGDSDRVSQQWQQILQRYGYTAPLAGALTDAVLSYLTQRGATLTTVTVAEIPRSPTVAAVLQTYQERICSRLWRVPDDIYPQALRDLQTWAEQQFGSLTTPIDLCDVVTLTAARGWQ